MKYFQNLSKIISKYIITVKFNLNIKFKLNIQMTEKVPDEFKKVMKDFYKDILTSFPEYKEKLGPTEIRFFTENR